VYLAARILPFHGDLADAQTASHESRGALYRRRVFSAQTSTPAAQWNQCDTYPVLADPFRGSRWEERPPSGPEGPGICPRRIDRRRPGPAPPATRPDATTYGGLPRLPAGQGARKWPRIGTKQHDRIRHTLIRSLGRARAGASQESSSPEGVHNGFRLTPKGTGILSAKRPGGAWHNQGMSIREPRDRAGKGDLGGASDMNSARSLGACRMRHHRGMR
jgi:hypothetical protein